MTTFLQAFNQHGPDTIAIAEALGISEAQADRLVNDHMKERYELKLHRKRMKAALQGQPSGRASA